MRKPLPPINSSILALAFGVGVVIAGLGSVASYQDDMTASKLALILLGPFGAFSFVGIILCVFLSIPFGGNMHDANIAVASILNAFIYGALAIPIFRRVVQWRAARLPAG